MSQKYEKLKTLLKELFQLDQPDLDFGFYRVMHARGVEVTQFLEKELLPQVKASFAQYQPADKAAIERELTQVVAGVQAAGLNPSDSPKVKELQTRLADDAVDLDALEAEVYDHLYSFFRRYYSKGDFLSKRVYKPGVYAIPYEGEEVKLHWANADQYYIKTSEYLRDYAFRLRPDNDTNPMRVHFRLVDAAEGEHGNVKEAAGKERRFKLATENFVVLEDGELVTRFTYAPDEAKQKELNAAAEAAILALADPLLAPWVKALGAQHVRDDGTAADGTRLRVHLDRYTARNTFDYFIHKDLGGFLRRELDFYIKNEVMHLDDVENESAPRVEQYLSKIKVIRRIAGKIIEFLAQLEDFQKKLWLKKKFVVETSWCIRLGVIPEKFCPEIAANDAQRGEWVSLVAIDEIKGDLTTPGYSKPLTAEFPKAHATLMVNTRHFDSGFTARLLEAIGNVEEQTDGVLIHGDNFQALSLMQARHGEGISCVCIDPPYNTGSDGFCYRDDYKDSSWMTQQHQTLGALGALLEATGSIFTCCDENEAHSYAPLLREIFGAENFVETIIWNKRVPKNDKGIGNIHDFVFLICNDLAQRRALGRTYNMRKDEIEEIYALVEQCRLQGMALEAAQLELKKFYRKQGYDRGITLYCELDPEFQIWGKINMSWPNPRTQGPRYEVANPVTGKAVPVPRNGWRWKEETFREAESQGSTRGLPDGSMMKGRIWYAVDEGTQPSSITYLKEVETFLLRSILSVKSDGGVWLENLGLGGLVDYPKPPTLIERLIFATGETGRPILDYFAGSGTTGHAVINLNQEDGGLRKFILVEMGDYFDAALLPRLMKVTFTPVWKDGKPKRLPTPEEAARSPRIMRVVRLESYEDTLNNLELRRIGEQQGLLDLAQAQGADKLKEQYMLRYLLDVETRGSQSLLNVAAFTDPTAYKLKVKRPGSDESREVNVDLLETFNWLIGLTVQHLAAPQTFTAETKSDGEGRLRLKGRLKPSGDGRWWFRTVTGTTPDGRKTLVIWRKRPGGESTEGIEQDNLILDEWFTKQGYSSKDSEFDLIYVNGDNNLENLKAPDDTWKVRLIEEDFFRLMFETDGV